MKFWLCPKIINCIDLYPRILATRIEVFCLFFGRIENKIICFRDLLTFICCCCSRNLEPKVFSRDCGVGVMATRANTLIIFSAELYCWPLPASPLFAKMWWASVLYYYVFLLVAYQHKYFVDTIEWKTDFWTKQQNKVDFGVTCFLPKWATILYLYVWLKPAFRIYQLTSTANPAQFPQIWLDWLC